MPFHYRMLFRHPYNHIPFIPFSMNRHPASSGVTQTVLQRTWWYYLSLELRKVICFLQMHLAGRHDSLGSFMKMPRKRQSKAKLARHMEKVGRGWHFCYLFVHHCHHNPQRIEQTHTGGLFLKSGSCYAPLLPSALCGTDRPLGADGREEFKRQNISCCGRYSSVFSPSVFSYPKYGLAFPHIWWDKSKICSSRLGLCFIPDPFSLISATYWGEQLLLKANIQAHRLHPLGSPWERSPPMAVSLIPTGCWLSPGDSPKALNATANGIRYVPGLF